MKKLVTLLVLPALLVIGCESNTQPAPEDKPRDIPDWAGGVSAEDAYYGFSMSKMSKVKDSMEDARGGARDDIARTVEVKVSNMLKRFSQESGRQVLGFYENVSKQVANQTLNGCKLAEKGSMLYKDGPMYYAKDGTVWALYVYSLSNVSQNALDAFKAEAREEALYNEFKASQAFKELDAAVEKPD